MYLDNLQTSIEYQGQRSRSLGFLCAHYCLNQLAWIHEMLHRHGPCAVLGLEQGRTFLFLYMLNYISVGSIRFWREKKVLPKHVTVVTKVFSRSNLILLYIALQYHLQSNINIQIPTLF